MLNLLHKIIILALFAGYAIIATAKVTEHEPNNTLKDAFPILVNANPNTYKFDYQGDEDWFVFYAEKGKPYNIEISDNSVGKGIDPALFIYNSQGEAEVTKFNFGFTGEGELLAWDSVPKSDFYYLKVSNLAPAFSVDAHYNLKIFEPFATYGVFLSGKVVDQCTNKSISSAFIYSSNGKQEFALSSGDFSMILNIGSYDITASVDGYINQTINFTESTKQLDTIYKTIDFSLMPTQGCVPQPVIIPDPSKAVAEFNSGNGILLIKEVRIGGGPMISAEMQMQNSNTFKLIKVDPVSRGSFDAPAYYDFETGLGKVPRVFFANQLFAVKLQDIGNNLFRLDGAPVVVDVR